MIKSILNRCFQEIRNQNTLSLLIEDCMITQGTFWDVPSCFEAEHSNEIKPVGQQIEKFSFPCKLQTVKDILSNIMEYFEMVAFKKSLHC